jgi:hypothetical protein
VPKCEPFTITWQPTTTNTISLLLLKGPSTNVIKHGPSLAEGIANSGSLVWTPSKDLEVTEGNHGYGLQIIDDVTGQYQWSTQFGLSKGNCEEVVSSSAAAPKPAESSAAAAYPAESAPAEYPAEASSEAPAYHVPQSTKAAYPTVAPYPTTVAVSKSVAVHQAPQGTASGAAYPTGTLAPMPSNNVTTFTGAASSVQAGLTFAGAVAAFALMF